LRLSQYPTGQGGKKSQDGAPKKLHTCPQSMSIVEHKQGRWVILGGYTPDGTWG
jgi:hypothetical protein